MFELYTEQARKVVFFARYEASLFGSPTIESEHILLGMIRGDRKVLQRVLPDSSAIEGIRKHIEDRVPVREKIPTTIDLPLSDECTGILSHAVEESQSLGHRHIDSIHLVLGILREENCLAAKVLKGLGLGLTALREETRKSREPETASGRPLISTWSSSAGRTALPAAGVVPDVDTAKRIAEAVWLPRLSKLTGDPVVWQSATLISGVWIVTGSHHGNDNNMSLAAFIQKEDGKILRLHMEKLNS